MFKCCTRVGPKQLLCDPNYCIYNCSRIRYHHFTDTLVMFTPVSSHKTQIRLSSDINVSPATMINSEAKLQPFSKNKFFNSNHAYVTLTVRVVLGSISIQLIKQVSRNHLFWLQPSEYLQSLVKLQKL